MGERMRGECRPDAWWEDRSVPQKVLMVIGFVILGAGFLALVGWVVMSLWNWLMQEIFGLPRVGYWQAWGLLILSSILFKGSGHGDKGGRADRKRRRELRKYLREGADGENVDAMPGTDGNPG
ncbi:MAG: hypothetical protein GX430_10025 [Treponema sp.]|nr:hypothetical protein [Treponema sp.]